MASDMIIIDCLQTLIDTIRLKQSKQREIEITDFFHLMWLYSAFHIECAPSHRKGSNDLLLNSLEFILYCMIFNTGDVIRIGPFDPIGEKAYIFFEKTSWSTRMDHHTTLPRWHYTPTDFVSCHPYYYSCPNKKKPTQYSIGKELVFTLLTLDIVSRIISPLHKKIKKGRIKKKNESRMFSDALLFLSKMTSSVWNIDFTFEQGTKTLYADYLSIKQIPIASCAKGEYREYCQDDTPSVNEIARRVLKL